MTAYNVTQGQTINTVTDKLKPGDTLTISGTGFAGFLQGYDVNGQPYGLISGTAAAPILIRGPATITKRNNKTPDAVMFDTNNGSGHCDYVTVQNLTIDADSSISAHGMRMTGSVGTKFLNNTVKNAGGFGIFSSLTVDCVIEGNTILGTKGTGNVGHGIYVSNSPVRAIIRNNTIGNSGSAGLQINGDKANSGNGSGIATACLIEGNTIYASGNNAINCDGIQNSTIDHNLIYANGKHGVILYTIDGGGPSSGNKILYNTFANETVKILNGAVNTTIMNNIIVGGAEGAIVFSTDSLPGLVCDYNLYVTGVKFHNDTTGRDYTFAQWQALGYDPHSKVVAPTVLFVAPAATPPDLHLVSTSPGLTASSTGGEVGAYGSAGSPPPPPPGYTEVPADQQALCEAADANKDGVVNILDLGIVGNAWDRKKFSGKWYRPTP